MVLFATRTCLCPGTGQLVIYLSFLRTIVAYSSANEFLLFSRTPTVYYSLVIGVRCQPDELTLDARGVDVPIIDVAKISLALAREFRALLSCAKQIEKFVK